MKLIDLLVKELPKMGGWPEYASICWCDPDGEIRFDNDTVRDFYPSPDFVNKNDRARSMGDASSGVTREQYESALAASEGWIEWGGGECPVETGTRVDVRYRDGEVINDTTANVIDSECRNASPKYWEFDGVGCDIIAYRLHRDINSRASDDRLEQDLNECIGHPVQWHGDGVPPVGIECEVKWTGGKWEKCEVLFVGTEKVVVEMRNREAAMSLCAVKFRPLRTEAENARDEAVVEMCFSLGIDRIKAEKCYDIASNKIRGVKLED